MRILMMTNTYDPVVGGIEQSIRSFSTEFRKAGHRVVIVAPTFENTSDNEIDVVRIPSIQHFLKEDVSVTLPIPFFLSRLIKEFAPDIIHSHHFFGVGDMALRLARQHHLPLIYTHHILLDQYANYFPIHHEGVKRFVLKLAAGYANLTDRVIAPSQLVREILLRDGVIKPIYVIPTGVDVKNFTAGDGLLFRQQWGIPVDSFVMGFVGRLNPEKNLEFLAQAAASFLQKNPQAHCLMIGHGSLKETIENIFTQKGVAKRLHCPGVLQERALS